MDRAYFRIKLENLHVSTTCAVLVSLSPSLSSYPTLGRHTRYALGSRGVISSVTLTENELLEILVIYDRTGCAGHVFLIRMYVLSIPVYSVMRLRLSRNFPMSVCLFP